MDSALNNPPRSISQSLLFTEFTVNQEETKSTNSNAEHKLNPRTPSLGCAGVYGSRQKGLTSQGHDVKCFS